jgi:hypothetical protein
MYKTDLDGKVIWENQSGERFFNPNEKPIDKCGWHKINIEGTVMWESPQGERSKS